MFFQLNGPNIVTKGESLINLPKQITLNNEVNLLFGKKMKEYRLDLGCKYD